MSSQYAQTRRAFLGTSVAVGAAAAIGGTLGYGSVASADEQVWDMAADFVVVGGGTGLGGAVAAAVNGMSVILLESRDAVGGAMALSGGCAWLPNTEYSQANGDTYELSLTYLTHMQQEYKNFEVMNAFLDNTQLTIATLAEGGVLLSPLPYPVEYHSDWEGACNGGGRTTVVAGEDGTMTTVGGGMRMNDALVKACENLGVNVFTGTTGKKLVTSRETSDSIPQVLGIIAEMTDGTTYAIKANRGVLLATGGFEWDEELVTNYVRVPCRYHVSYSTNNGGALRMCQSVGADLRLMNEFWGQSVYTVQGEYAKERGIPCSICCQTERAVPGSVMVDNNGRRFCNEASDYDSQGNTMGGYNNYFDNGWSADPAWLIYDNTCYETYNVVGRGQDTGFPSPDIPEEEMVIVADTLEELAEIIGVNSQQLIKTVEEFNEGARQGIDPLFHRGETMRPLSTVSETLAPLETPPYRAISISSGSLGTKGGPRLNGNAQVIHVEGEPIVGLYAMGNCAGVGGPGPAYGGGGGTIGPAFVMGVLAARHAAAREDVTDTDFFVIEQSHDLGYEAGENEYITSGKGIGGDVIVCTSIEDGAIASVEILEHHETEGIGTNAIDSLPAAIVEAQGVDVDVVTGATVTSNAIISAVSEAMSQAGMA